MICNDTKSPGILLNKKTVIECIVIVIISGVAGLSFNALRPNGLKITSKRPVTNGVADSIFFQDITSKEAMRLQEPVVIQKNQLLRLLQRQTAVVLDARTPEEYIAGHIVRALNIPAAEFYQYESVLNQVPMEKWIICYCDGPPCDLGELLASHLFARGYPWVAFYLDGLNDWKTTEKIELE